MNNPRTVFQVDGLPNQINIGRMTEKGVREIGFDVTSWMAHWPTMEISVWVTAPKPSTTGAYLANITREGNVITWHVNDADTAIAGNGTVEVCGITPDKKKLSASAVTVIEKTTTHRTGPAPEPGEDYISRVLAAEDAAQGFANAAEASAERAENVNLHPAYINESDKHWYSYDSEEGLYVDTGVVAEGENGEAGYSPEVTITAITGGHTVKITDEDHPDGQTFNVMDGEDGEAPIDDTTPAVNKVYSSQKVSSELTSLNQAIVALPTSETGSEWANKEELNTELVDLFVGEVDRMFSTGLPQESTMGRVITQLSLGNGLLNDLYLGMEVS